jgi:hypothetical protein
MREYKNYLPLALAGIILLISFINDDSLFYDALKSIFLSETTFGWFLTCLIFILVLMQPFFLVNIIGRWACFFLSLYMVINLELIFSMRVVALALSYPFPNSTFGVATIFGFVFAVLIMMKTKVVDKRGILLLILSILMSTLIASYWMVKVYG